MKYNQLLQTVRDLPRQAIARVVISLYPTDQWYRKAWSLSKYFCHFKKKSNTIKRSSFGVMHAIFLDGILNILTETGKPFYIPVRVNGLEILNEASKEGKLLCSLHMPLIRVAINVIVRKNTSPVHIIRFVNHPPEGTPVWGLSGFLPSILVGPQVLLKTRSRLKDGDNVTVLVDFELGLRVSDNMMTFAQRIGATVVFFTAELLTDGYIEISFLRPTPAPDQNDEVHHRLRELQKLNTTILRRYGDLTIGDFTSEVNRLQLTKPADQAFPA